MAQIRQPQYSLGGIAMLAGLSPDALARIQQSCSWRRYESGEPIVEYLDRSDDVFFITEGEAKVIIYSIAGKVVSFSDLRAGDTFGEYPALDGRPLGAV